MECLLKLKLALFFENLITVKTRDLVKGWFTLAVLSGVFVGRFRQRYLLFSFHWLLIFLFLVRWTPWT